LDLFSLRGFSQIQSNRRFEYLRNRISIFGFSILGRSGRSDLFRPAPVERGRESRFIEIQVLFSMIETGNRRLPWFLYECLYLQVWTLRSGRSDLNRRPPAPQAGALSHCATPRCLIIRIHCIVSSRRFLFYSRSCGARPISPAFVSAILTSIGPMSS
jgi:hypothetical protein